MGLFDIIKKAFGLADESEEQPQAPQEAPTGPKPAARGPSGIAGWEGPQAEDPEVAMEAHKLMSWVIHEEFNASSFEAEPFQRGLDLLDARGADQDLHEILKRAAIRLREHPPLWRRLARLYTTAYDHESARNAWQKLIDQGRYIGEASFHLGEIAERQGKLLEAATSYQRAIAHDPENPRAWQRAEALRDHLPMPRKAAAATVGGTEASLEGLGIRAPDGYTLKHPLGRGGYGTVYLASDDHLHRDVAIKFLHPHLTRDARRVEAFFEEARLVARLGLPGVVRIYDLDQEARVIIMEFLTRGTLRDRLASGRALAPRAALRVAIRLLRTLSRLHRTGIIHRDLKPENILFRANGASVLGDFGVAALEDHTAATRAAGTLAYMAPEQKQGAAIDRRADLYAVGLILVEMLAGGLPAGAAGQVHPPEVFIAMLPRAVAQLVGPTLTRLLAVDPAARPADATQVIASLQALNRQFGAQDQVPTLVEELERLLEATSPDDLEARTRLEAMRRALTDARRHS